jgi:hypothetical protein
VWIDCSCICRDDTRCARGRARQAKSVRILLLFHASHHRTRWSSGIYAAIASFLTFSMIQFRDGPFVRPHPAFWRIVLGINLLYELLLVFLLFQDLDTARFMMTLIDSNLGTPLPEKSYAEDCSLTAANIWVRTFLGFCFQRPKGIVECSRHILCCSCSGLVW